MAPRRPRTAHQASRQLQDRLRRPKTPPRRLKMPPRQPQDGPRRLKMAPRRLQDGSIWHQYAPRQPIWAQDGPKIVPRWLQDGPKTAQDCPMTPQDGPEAPKRSPEMPQDEPRRLKRPQNSQSNVRTVDGSSVHSRHRLRRPGRIIFAQYSSY